MEKSFEDGFSIAVDVDFDVNERVTGFDAIISSPEPHADWMLPRVIDVYRQFILSLVPNFEAIDPNETRDDVGWHRGDWKLILVWYHENLSRVMVTNPCVLS
jgi:hypothetical protein